MAQNVIDIRTGRMIGALKSETAKFFVVLKRTANTPTGWMVVQIAKRNAALA